MVFHPTHLHQDEAKDFECLIVVGYTCCCTHAVAHAHSSKPILERDACALFMLSVAAQSADNCLVCVYLLRL